MRLDLVVSICYGVVMPWLCQQTVESQTKMNKELTEKAEKAVARIDMLERLGTIVLAFFFA